ncbi:MAG: cellulase family glycosylhydrolase [Anaerolineae bacterium]|nr:cellulase family glycosylhydrolase [Anaerolineae bacterium]
MTTNFIKIALKAVGLAIVGLLAGCIVVPGGQVVVTHTPAPATATETSVLPTLTPTPSWTPSLTSVPPTPTPIPATETPGGTFGPAVDASYTLQPTDTAPPPATETPPGPTPTPMPQIHSNHFGVQIHPLISEQDMQDLLRRVKFDIGARWVKFQVEWELLQPQPDQRGKEWWLINEHVQYAYDNGFQVLISIVSAPDWTRSPVDLPEYPDTPYPLEGPPDDYQLYANFVNDMAQGFANRIDAIEIWNEPNLQREWFGKPLGGDEYMRMFDVVYRTVRAGSNPGIMLVTAAPAPTGINDRVTAIDDRQFIREMYAAGLANYDQNVALGVHPYGWGNPPSWTCAANCNTNPDWSWDDQPTFFFLDTLNDYHAIMEQYGDTTHKMWVTEFGWPTFDGFGVAPDPAFGYYNYVSEQDQGQHIVEALAYAESQPYIEKMFLWNVNWAIFQGYDGIGPTEQEAGYAIIRPDGSPRPAYQLIQMMPKEEHPAVVSPYN